MLFVPEVHELDVKLPAVSGSSGHLVVERSSAEKEAAYWPGMVFENAELTYEEAMNQYILETRDRLEHRKRTKVDEKSTDATWRKEWEARSERYQVRKQREQENMVWKAAKKEWHDNRLEFGSLSRDERKQRHSELEQAEKNWKDRCDEQQKILQKRKREDQEWHKHNQERKVDSLPERTWIAVLVIIDNCSRQCLGLPIFRSGSHVTSEEVVVALRDILPHDLAFLISDQGIHFRSKIFARLAKEKDFVQVPIYRHRPQSNGIAERFVLTFKDWLRDKSWPDLAGLEILAQQFQPHYNDRPHQGLPIPGLSPNEFAQRIWAF